MRRRLSWSARTTLRNAVPPPAWPAPMALSASSTCLRSCPQRSASCFQKRHFYPRSPNEMPDIATRRIGDPTTPRVANDNHRGLTTAQAQARLKQYGPNAVVEEKAHPLSDFLKRFWAPI